MSARGPEAGLPVVGIPQCLDARGRWRAGRSYLYADRAYADGVSRAGAVALHLPIQPNAEALVATIDGLLLPGGDDLMPGPEAAHAYPADAFDPTPQEQLDFDRALLVAALEAGKPVLGVCYGMQLVVEALGGRLHYHLPVDLPGARHRLDPGECHAIEIAAGTRLREVIGSGSAQVNSLHHQAVADPGAALRVSARAPDGVIEAVEDTTGDGDRWCLGVQWHPEKLEGAPGLGLLEAFVGRARERRSRSGWAG